MAVSFSVECAETLCSPSDTVGTVHVGKLENLAVSVLCSLEASAAQRAVLEQSHGTDSSASPHTPVQSS